MNELRGEHLSPNDLSAKLFHNKLSVYSVNFLGHYLVLQGLREGYKKL